MQIILDISGSKLNIIQALSTDFKLTYVLCQIEIYGYSAKISHKQKNDIYYMIKM
jgi:hypothetical protein